MNPNRSKKSLASTLFILSAIFYNPSSASSRSFVPFTTKSGTFATRKSASESTQTKRTKKKGSRTRHSQHSFHNNDILSKYDDNSNDNDYAALKTRRKSRSYDQYFEKEFENDDVHLSTLESTIKRTNSKKQYDDNFDTDSEPIEEENSTRLLQLPLALELQHDSPSSDRRTPIKTFLDTGAQVTIMSLEAAKRAGIAHLIDTRYAGHASGVAGVSCRVLGRIPARTVSFVIETDDGTHVLDKSPAITVLENEILGGGKHGGVDMLVGLDVLEEWKATLCLYQRTLTVRDAKIGGETRSKKSSSSNNDVVIPLMRGGGGRVSVPRQDSIKKIKEVTHDRKYTSSIDSEIYTKKHESRQRHRSDIIAPSTNSYRDNHYKKQSDGNTKLDGYFLSPDEEDEYCDENYYFIDNEVEEFDECDLSGV